MDVPVLYVHGIGNKIASAPLKRRWDRALFGSDLGTRSRMAYWADLRYPAPLQESTSSGDVEEVFAAPATTDGRPGWSPPEDAEAFLAATLAGLAGATGVTEAGGAATTDPRLTAWGRRMAYTADALAADEPMLPASPTEAFPAPRPIRQAVFRALVERTLQDVHAYFFGGQGRAIRARVQEALQDLDGPVVVIGHSLGSVVAYDVLRAWRGSRLDVPLLVTLGSPLGITEIQDVVVQPLEVPRVVDHWVNACDTRDLVALDETVRDEYRPAGRVRDYIVRNDSENHHGAGEYLRAAVVQQVVHAAVDGAHRRRGGPRGPEGGRRLDEQDLHAAVTNLVPDEDGGVAELLAPGTRGRVGAAPTTPDGREAVPRPEGPGTTEVTAPDVVLPDIGAASYLGLAEPGTPLETVHGLDDRVQVDDTARYPWSAHASLLITARDGSQWIGTGWFVSPRTLVTAGHCVFITNSPVAARNGWVLSIQVMPGRNGTHLPFGAATATRFWTVRGWAQHGDENFDYGAVVVPTPLGDTVGTLGFAVRSDDELLGGLVNVSGYPGDQPPGTLWYDSRTVATTAPSKVHYDLDTAGGQSGGPVYVVEGDDRVAVAIHAYGGPTTNSGTRISRRVFDNLVDWEE
ncbi:trypsin-like peptidase domain-containing protein [Geodermatophilus sp. SYSU D00758]